jgi:hypothetical protein
MGQSEVQNNNNNRIMATTIEDPSPPTTSTDAEGELPLFISIRITSFSIYGPLTLPPKKARSNFIGSSQQNMGCVCARLRFIGLLSGIDFFTQVV